MAPIKVSDVEASQKEVLAVADAADSGEIMLGGGADEFVTLM